MLMSPLHTSFHMTVWFFAEPGYILVLNGTETIPPLIS